jgi:hypothetical protein
MDTAFIASGPASVRRAGHATLVERISRRVGLALVEWSRRAEQRRSHEYLAELYERRQEAERLREERFRDVALSRLL